MQSSVYTCLLCHCTVEMKEKIKRLQQKIKKLSLKYKHKEDKIVLLNTQNT